MKWDGTVGPSSLISLVGGLGALVMIGIAWGSLQSDVKAGADKTTEARSKIEAMSKHAEGRDRKVAEQGERLGKIETSIQFIVPALQRIESKLDAAKP